MESEQVLEAEKFAFALFVLLNALEIATLIGCIIANIRLLLFVDLTSVDDLFNGASGYETKNLDVT